MRVVYIIHANNLLLDIYTVEGESSNQILPTETLQGSKPVTARRSDSQSNVRYNAAASPVISHELPLRDKMPGELSQLTFLHRALYSSHARGSIPGWA